MKDTMYYNKESALYSKKRYPESPTEYQHFFFKRRLDILIKAIDYIFSEYKKFSIIEVGCADGIVLKNIKKNFNKRVNLVGVDISQDMIDVAKNTSEGAYQCFLRDDKELSVDKYDAVVEVGVINFTDFKAEIDHALSKLKDGGYYLCSVAGNSSIFNKIKKNEGDYFNFLDYTQYESLFREKFQIIKIFPYGYFPPYLWKIPFIARIVQPALDFLFSLLLPNLAHEKFYILKKR